MQHLLRRMCVAAIALTATAAALAYNIRGTVAESGTLEPLIQASVRLLAARDSAIVKTAVSDIDGNFTLDNVKAGHYIVEASYVGYTPQMRSIQLKKNMRLDTLLLSPGSIMLKEATVLGIRTPIKVMDDTVEFNADSYKTQPNAVVEDLLKRLPGVEVDSEGKITANGKSVSKILIDGKEFFADDPTVASRNLPVNMVDKLQVVDRKSDLARITGVDDGEEETVINLTVKKGMNNGWFGSVEGGYGTDDRYKGSFNVNRFWNGNQLTLLGGANNVNDMGFGDGASGRFRRFGGSRGVTTSRALGLNFNVGKEEIIRVGGDVMYSYSDRDTRQLTDRQYLFADSTSYYNSGRNARDRGHNVRVDLRVQWKPDSFNTVDFRPRFSWNRNDSHSNDSSLTSAGDAMRSPVTRSLNMDDSRGTSVEFGGTFIYNHSFRRHRGRSFSVFANYSFSNVRERSDSYSWNRFFQLADSTDLYDQWTDNHTWSNSIRARASWTEPLGDARKGNFLTLSYSINYRWNNADRLTYDHPVDWPQGWDGEPVVGEELIFNDELSNRFRNTYFSQDIRLGYKHVSKATNLEAGLSLVPQSSRSIDLINDARSIPERNVLNFAPFLRFRVKFNKQRSLNMFYNGRSSQPSMSQLQPVADKTDPLNIVIGNPDLKPTFTHNLHLRFQDFNPEAQRSIMAMMMANMTQNNIVSRTTFDSTTGGRTTTYTNVNGVWSVRAMGMYSQPLRNRTFTFNNHLMAFYSRGVGFNNGLRNVSGQLSINESFSFAWRPTSLELELRPNYGLQHVVNSLPSQPGRTVHNYGGTFNATWYAPFGLVVNTDLSYTSTSGYSAGFDTNEWMWNASLSYQFLKGRNATVSLRAYDLLQQRSNISRNVTANYIDDTRYNSLTRYFMLSFTYKFTTFKGGDQPRDRNADRWHGPMGPPPGGPGGPGGPGPR
ncbi:MAG: outer membrane beta-barrel protein [Muribaculaceae bacterium]|nr:outer membrane beta-barrel protein [Muribaculaceae bacterium]